MERATMTKTKRTNRTVPEGKLLLDDLWLNEAENTLGDIARRCEQEFGHKPSLEDFRQLLQTVLCVELEEWFSDGANKDVTSVVFKTKKKPAAQRYKDGDVFAIPLDEERYAFGRILHDMPWGGQFIGTLLEIFRETSTSKKYRPSIVASGRLFYPRFEDPLACLKNRRWTVIASDDAYRFPEADQDLEFLVPDPRRRGFSGERPFSPGSPSRPLTEEEWRRMEANGQGGGIGRPEDLEERIRVALKGMQP
jgi:hypothetical protein